MLKKLIASGALSVSALAIAAFFIPSVSAADDANQDKSPAIRMVALNKGAFKTGEEVYALVRWSVGDLILPFKGSQISGKTSIINVTITKGDKLCADPAVLTLFSGETEAYLPIKATADCVSPTVRAILINADGQLVSDRMVMIAGGVEVASDQVKQDEKIPTPGAVANQENPFRSLGFVIAIALAGIGVIAILIVLIRRRSVTKKMSAFILVLGLSAIASGAYVVEAQFSMMFPPQVVIYLDSNSYNAGETITITGEDIDCYGWLNGSSFYTDIAVSLQGTRTQIVGPVDRVAIAASGDISKCTGTKSITVPSVPVSGVYDLTVYIRKYSYASNLGYDPGYDIPILSVGGIYDMTKSGGFYAGVWEERGGITYDGVVDGYAQYTVPITIGGSALPTPTVSFYPDSYSISGGTATNLHWTATNATSCTASGAWSGAKAVSGTESTGILSVSQVYFLSCTGPGGTSPLYTVPLTVIPVIPATPTVDLKVNGSDGPLTLASGATKTLSWTATDATSCVASGVDAFTGSKAIPSGSETLTVARTSTDTLICTGPGGTTSDSVQINATCTPSTGTWGDCDCTTETRTRTNINASCFPWTESDACTIDEKNSCRDFNWKEVAP